MKKRTIVGAALLAPVLLFTACAGGNSNLALSANWYASSDITTNISGTKESLEYSVVFESTGTDAYAVDYDDGVYTAELVSENVTVGNTQEPGYHLRTTLTMTGRYTVNGATGEDFTDTVVSDVWFRNVTTELQPIRSVKTVQCHTPNANAQSTDEAYTYYEYTYTAEYDHAMTKADITIDYVQPERDDVSRSTPLSGTGTYLDNEQILFALRGLNMTSAVALRTINPVTGIVTTLSATAPSSTTETMRFSVNGAGGDEDRSIAARSLSIQYSSANSGSAQQLVYAAKVTDANSNTYRNVLLRMETSVIHSLGTLRYTLTSAQFNEK